MNGSVIAIANMKGGVGKTTLAMGIGVMLEEMGYKTLLVDLDPQAHLTAALFPTVLPNYNVFDLLQRKPYQIHQVKGTNNLYLLPSNLMTFVQYYGSPLSSVHVSMFGHQLWSEMHQKLKEDFDYILIDCPPEPVFSSIGLRAADYLVIPTDPSELSIRGAIIFIENIFTAENKKRGSDMRARALSIPSLKLLGVVIIKARRGAAYYSRIGKIESVVSKYINTYPGITKDIYSGSIIFNSKIGSHDYLQDIQFENTRHRIPPIVNILKGNAKTYENLRQDFRELTGELLDRIKNF